MQPAALSARILLVDDNSAGLMARRVVLEELGYSTEGARDAMEALELFRAHHFDLVVTDFKMPSMDGVELITELRSFRPDIPIILISGFVDALGLTEAATGATVVIMKSANEVAHLVRSVGRLVKVPKKPPATHRPTLLGRRKSG